MNEPAAWLVDQPEINHRFVQLDRSAVERLAQLPELTITPLYTHPAPAAPVVLQQEPDAPRLVDVLQFSRRAMVYAEWLAAEAQEAKPQDENVRVARRKMNGAFAALHELLPRCFAAAPRQPEPDACAIADFLCEEAWQGRWNPKPSETTRPIAQEIARVLAPWFASLAAPPPVDGPPAHNVVVRLSVVRPDDEYLPALLRHRIVNAWGNEGARGWDSYAGHIRVAGVDVLSGHSPFPPGTAAEAIATIAPVVGPP